MIDERKLIEALNEIPAYFDNSDIRYGINIAISEVIKQPKVGEWISCKDRLPNNNRLVLVLNEYEICIGYYDVERKWWYDSYDDFMEYTPVAWCELPDPYKGD